MNIGGSLMLGIAAGAAGTAALDVASYVDMTYRGRPASEMPAKIVEALASRIGLTNLLGEDERRFNRRSAVGALLGYANGLGVGALFGLAHPMFRRAPLLCTAVVLAGTAMALSDVPAAALGVTDPKAWTATDWLSDIVPHAAYGLALALTFDLLRQG